MSPPALFRARRTIPAWGVGVKKFLVASQKGGVGKTTTVVNLATSAALAGGKILVVDCDPLGGARVALGVGQPGTGVTLREIGADSDAPLWRNIVPGLDLTTPYGQPGGPAHTLEEFLILLHDSAAFTRYDTLFFDCPPVIGGYQLRQLIRVCDEMILVLRAEPLAFKAVPNFLRIINSVQEEGSPVRMSGILLTLPAGEPLGGSWEAELRRVFASTLLPQAIPFDPEVTRAQALGKPVLIASPRSVAARQYTGLSQRLGLARSEDDAVDDAWWDSRKEEALSWGASFELERLE